MSNGTPSILTTGQDLPAVTTAQGGLSRLAIARPSCARRLRTQSRHCFHMEECLWGILLTLWE
jgi:hypothetical protein